jgi:aminoglycoside 6'-N-acetyltransferase
MVVEGELTALRPAQGSDLDLLARWFREPEVYRWWGGSPLPPETVAAKYTGKRRPRVESFVIEAEGRPVGYIQYHYGFEPYHRQGEGGIDMFIAPGVRRRGLGRDAARALVRHLLVDRGWRRVTVDPSKENPGALAFWRAVGFVYERDIDSKGPAELLQITREKNADGVATEATEAGAAVSYCT